MEQFAVGNLQLARGREQLAKGREQLVKDREQLAKGSLQIYSLRKLFYSFLCGEKRIETTKSK
jgi:hypothetical protein